MVPKTPFIIYQEFLSPLLCEEVIDLMDVTTPDIDAYDNPVPSIRHNTKAEQIILERLREKFNSLEKYYNVEYRGTEKMLFEWYPQGSTGELVCDSSEYMNGKWTRIRDRDITAVLFLSEYSEAASFDIDYETYGGKLEFPNHNFGFNPERGTLVVFPSTPHFLNATSQVVYGDLFQVRIHIATKTPFMYQPADFPGNFLTWFPNLLG